MNLRYLSPNEKSVHNFGNKIIVIGSPGAGKSTLARKISEITGITLHHLDRIHWMAGWKPIEDDEFVEKQQEIFSEHSWIIDGNYQTTLNLRIDAADTVLFLDLPRRLCLFRALKRSTLFRNVERTDMAEGCPEKVNMDFLKWIWNYKKRDRPKTIEALNNSAGKNIIILKTSKEVRDFIEAMASKKTNIG